MFEEKHAQPSTQQSRSATALPSYPMGDALTNVEDRLAALYSERKIKVNLVGSIVIKGVDNDSEIYKLVRSSLQSHGIDVLTNHTKDLSSDLSKLENNSNETVATSRVQITTKGEGKYTLELFSAGRSHLKLQLTPANSEKLSQLAAFANAALSNQKEWIEEIKNIYDVAAFIGGSDGLIELDPKRALNSQAIDKLKKTAGGGVIRLYIEENDGTPRVLSLYPSTLEKLRKGGLRINGRVLQTTLSRQVHMERIDEAELNQGCASSTPSRWSTNVSTGSHLPPDTATLTINCSGADQFAERPGFLPYSIPLKGLQDAELKNLVVHRPYIKTDDGLYSTTGSHELSKNERRTAQEIMSGAHDLEREFGLKKGTVVRQLVLAPDDSNGPHVIPQLQPFAIRVPESDLTNITDAGAKAIGRHEAAHLIDSLFEITERSDSKLNAHYKQMISNNESYFSSIDESHMYQIQGGHSKDDSKEYFASLVNSVCHPKIEDILRRSNPEFKKHYVDGLVALLQDLQEAGLDVAKVPIGKKIEKLISQFGS